MDMSRPIMSGVLVAAITAGLQYMAGGLNLPVAGIDGALMAASVVATDAIALGHFIPEMVPPSLVAGAVYAAGQAFVRGDKNYVMNGLVGAAADKLTDAVSG